MAPRVIGHQCLLNCATLANGTKVLLHDPSELCLVTSSFTFIYGLASTIFWVLGAPLAVLFTMIAYGASFQPVALGAPLAVLFTMIAYGVPTLAADKVRETEVRAEIRHHYT
ncbi:hypothetical protein T484DRAFT_1780084 [Baffinella frigidus]|nr:hypothetical protein T484DRAFT_1780084 [Cryptophyta sp. CCMP2293]